MAHHGEEEEECGIVDVLIVYYFGLLSNVLNYHDEQTIKNHHFARPHFIGYGGKV
jgi:hypothetical protein